MRSGEAVAGIVDEPLVNHILTHVAFYVSDGDSASHLAGHMLHRNSERAALAGKLPNLRVIIRDRAHSSRHLNEHSFAADPVLHSLFQTAVLQQHSIVRQLKDSQPLRQIFVAEARSQTFRDDFITVVTDMSFAAQRFDSLQKPLGRIVLNLEALLSYCHVVTRERGATSAEGQRCLEFLQCITEQSVVLLGMMADASDECMLLTRLMDRDTFDVGCVHVELQKLHDRINHLFLNKACLTCNSSYTKVALEFLKRPRVLETPVVRTLGCTAGVCETHVMLALARMVNWVKVTKQISDTEFPQHDLLSALKVLCLRPAADGSSNRARGFECGRRDKSEQARAVSQCRRGHVDLPNTGALARRAA